MTNLQKKQVIWAYGSKELVYVGGVEVRGSRNGMLRVEAEDSPQHQVKRTQTL